MKGKGQIELVCKGRARLPESQDWCYPGHLASAENTGVCWNPQMTIQASEDMDSPGTDNKEPLQLHCAEVSLDHVPCTSLWVTLPQGRRVIGLSFWAPNWAVVFTKKRRIQDTGYSGL